MAGLTYPVVCLTLKQCFYRITYLFFIFKLDLFFFTNLFPNFFECFKCRLFKKISGNIQKIFVNNETLQIPINISITFLLIFDDKSYFLFSQPAPKPQSHSSKNFCYIFSRHHSIISILKT